MSRRTGLRSLALGFLVAAPAIVAAAVELGTAGTYGVLSSTFTRNGGITVISGDAGYTTLSGSGVHTVSGVNYMPAVPQAGLDQDAALAALNGATCTYSFAAGAIDLASNMTHGNALPGVFTPGVYCINGAMSIDAAGTITLQGAGTYIFRSLGSFTSSANANVVLTGGARASDVYWIPTQATTLGANNVFVGTVIDDADITVGTMTRWNGRALAFGGTVTLDTDTISVPYSGPNPPPQGKSFAHPSASGGAVNVVYHMRESGSAAIRIWNENGDLATTLEERKQPGPQKSQVSVSRFAPGIYLYSIVLTYDSGQVERMKLQKFSIAK